MNGQVLVLSQPKWKSVGSRAVMQLEASFVKILDSFTSVDDADKRKYLEAFHLFSALICVICGKN